MFGVGLPEFAVIAVVGILVFGPDKLPELARQAGRLIRQARKMANSARDELRSELGPEYADLELRDLDPREIVRKHLSEALAEEDEEEEQPRKPRRTRPGLRPLAEGERPPYDTEAT